MVLRKRSRVKLGLEWIGKIELARLAKEGNKDFGLKICLPEESKGGKEGSSEDGQLRLCAQVADPRRRPSSLLKPQRKATSNGFLSEVNILLPSLIPPAVERDYLVGKRV